MTMLGHVHKCQEDENPEIAHTRPYANSAYKISCIYQYRQ